MPLTRLLLAFVSISSVSIGVVLGTVLHASMPTTEAAAVDCSGTLQAMIDAAAPGATVNVPACVYRESPTLSKAVTLDGGGKAEVRGSDVWANWQRSGNLWTQGSVPSLPTAGEVCSTERCHHPEQVIFDGKPLEWVGSNPQTGQFALDASRNILIADDPACHTVEVTTRQRWFNVQSDNVTISGFVMRHSASAPNAAASLSNQGRNNFTLQDSNLSYGHGALVSIGGGSNNKVLRNDIHHGGQIGIDGWDSSSVLVQNNAIHDNNTDGFEWGWAAGGMKANFWHGAVIENNEAYGNAGPGLWCDIDCSNVTFSNNRVHDNILGIMYEISSGSRITGNQVWRSAIPGWPAIYAASSSDVEIDHNTVYDSGRGIQAWQDGRHGVSNVNIHDNNVVMSTNAIAYMVSGEGGVTGPNNRGSNNKAWYPTGEDGQTRFVWMTQSMGTIAAFRLTPLGQSARYLTNGEKNAAILGMQ